MPQGDFMKFSPNIVTALAIASVSLGLATSASAQYYTVQDLGQVDAYALNAFGQVAGVDYSGSSAQGFYTGVNGIGMNVISLPEGSGNSWAYGINDQGQVVGQYADGAGDARGFVTGSGGQGFTGVSYPGSGSVNVLAINGSGQYVGWADSQAIASGAQGNGWQTLDIPSNLVSIASAINASGQVLGVAADPQSENSYTTFLTGPNGQGFNQVGSPLGVPFFGGGLNNHGDVVGQAFTESGMRAFFVGANNGTTIDLGTLGGTFSRAMAINDQGAIVGFSTAVGDYTGSNSEAFIILGEGQEMVRLSSLTVNFEGSLSEAVAVNNAGQILTKSFGRSYLLTPTAIPEAQTSAMMLLGLGAIAWIGVRQQRRRHAQA
ncbi:MAG: hypothetical protein C0487_18580 [Leptothrix sp. (in: Bacteria)]|nr:hypothetical protein [Leptothrix sp. (in: b-proteobacteria)]